MQESVPVKASVNINGNSYGNYRDYNIVATGQHVLVIRSSKAEQRLHAHARESRSNCYLGLTSTVA